MLKKVNYCWGLHNRNHRLSMHDMLPSWMSFITRQWERSLHLLMIPIDWFNSWRQTFWNLVFAPQACSTLVLQCNSQSNKTPHTGSFIGFPCWFFFLHKISTTKILKTLSKTISPFWFTNCIAHYTLWETIYNNVSGSPWVLCGFFTADKLTNSKKKS